MKKSTALLSIVIAGMTVSVPITTSAADRIQKTENANRYSHSDQMPGQRLSRDKVKAIQEALKDKGNDPGQIDGIMGASTQQALRKFQKSENLEVTGRVDEKTASALGVDVASMTSGTAGARTQRSDMRYSDRDRRKNAKDSEDKLERALKTGESKEFYRRELEKMGWMITSVNYDKPDYVEYEIVKGDDSYEVQLDFDKNSNKATKVDVALNAWQTDATDKALKDKKKVAYPNTTTTNPERYSERDRMKTSKDSEDKLEQALKTGEEKAFYRRELEKMGWKVTSVNYDKPDYVEYEIVKGNDSYEVQIDFDKSSNKASKVDIAMNAWKADATKQALKQQTQARR